MIHKLSVAQKAMLIRICKTNGGGVNCYELAGPTMKTVRCLEKLGLAQGKAGAPWRAVHTDDGWALYKNAFCREEGTTREVSEWKEK